LPEPSPTKVQSLEEVAMMKGRKITKEEILACQTENGGWTKKTLAQWGVPWPPPKGWKDALIKNGTLFEAPSQSCGTDD
jgi:hypothetical protein